MPTIDLALIATAKIAEAIGDAFRFASTDEGQKLCTELREGRRNFRADIDRLEAGLKRIFRDDKGENKKP